jgi:DNA-binding transcriptional LysR family regulator
MSFHLDDLALFARVSALGTLSAAARERNIPVSQVTRALNRLEAACGARLMHRTTHGLSLTDEGDTLLQHGSLMLDTSEVLKADLRGRQNEPSGWVRVGVSASVAESLIAPSLPALYEKYPRLHIEVLADDRLADMARDGIDIAIRTAAVHSETLVARQIGSASRTLYASPSYLAKNGTPQHPDELAQHHMIGNSRAISMNLWERQDAKSGLQIKGQTLTDNSAVLLSMVCSNHLTGSGNSVPVRVSIACANSGTCLELIVSLPNASCRRLWHRQRAWSWISRLYLIGGTESGRIFPFTHPHSDKRNHAPFIHTTSFG